MKGCGCNYTSLRQYGDCVVDLLALINVVCGVYYCIMCASNPNLVSSLIVPALYPTFESFIFVLLKTVTVTD